MINWIIIIVVIMGYDDDGFINAITVLKLPFSNLVVKIFAERLKDEVQFKSTLKLNLPIPKNGFWNFDFLLIFISGNEKELIVNFDVQNIIFKTKIQINN